MRRILISVRNYWILSKIILVIVVVDFVANSKKLISRLEFVAGLYGIFRIMR
jgi:hypothetical protein